MPTLRINVLSPFPLSNNQPDTTVKKVYLLLHPTSFLKYALTWKSLPSLQKYNLSKSCPQTIRRKTN